MLLTRLAFGLPADPWARHQQTADAARIDALVRAAVDARALAQVVGPRGGGKTSAVRATLADLDAEVVEPLRLDPERLRALDITAAIVRQLSSETPRQSAEARSVQARRLLGRASAKRPVALVIDDAHELHPSTLRALKRLREWAWQGRWPLVGVLLVGQTDRAAAVPEVGLRSSTVELAGLTEAEAGEALEAALGAALAADARELLAGSPWARGWLDLQRLADECLLEAQAQGETVVTASCARAVLGAVARPGREPAAGAAANVDDVLARRGVA